MLGMLLKGLVVSSKFEPLHDKILIIIVIGHATFCQDDLETMYTKFCDNRIKGLR